MLFYVSLFVLLLAGHALADSLLQPPWLSIMKRDRDPEKASEALMLHGFVHAFFVGVFTESGFLAAGELLFHPFIDHAKARGWFGAWVDQGLHVLCKLLWVVIIYNYPGLP